MIILLAILVLLIGLPLCRPSLAAAEPFLFADIDRDGKVDFDDFFLFADQFGQICTDVDCSELTANFNGDEIVDFDDFFLFADQFGQLEYPLLTAPSRQFVDLGKTLSLPIVESSIVADSLFIEIADNPLPDHAFVDSESGAFTFRPGVGQFNQTFSFSIRAQFGNRVDGTTVEVRVTGSAIDEDLLGVWEQRQRVGGRELLGLLDLGSNSGYVGQFFINGQVETISQYPYTVVGDTLVIGSGQILRRAASGEFTAEEDRGVEYVRYVVIGDELVLFIEDVDEEQRSVYTRSAESMTAPAGKLAFAQQEARDVIRHRPARGRLIRFDFNNYYSQE